MIIRDFLPTTQSGKVQDQEIKCHNTIYSKDTIYSKVSIVFGEFALGSDDLRAKSKVSETVPVSQINDSIHFTLHFDID